MHNAMEYPSWQPAGPVGPMFAIPTVSNPMRFPSANYGKVFTEMAPPGGDAGLFPGNNASMSPAVIHLDNVELGDPHLFVEGVPVWFSVFDPAKLHLANILTRAGYESSTCVLLRTGLRSRPMEAGDPDIMLHARSFQDCCTAGILLSVDKMADSHTRYRATIAIEHFATVNERYAKDFKEDENEIFIVADADARAVDPYVPADFAAVRHFDEDRERALP